jgi:chromatin segregation and condensation protein Rec8/ScpA/Scc1 (kleisin family)
MTDRLSLTNALADANIERQKAERIATEIFDAIHENVATKADVAALQADLQRVEAALKAELKAEITAARAEVSALEQRMLVRLAELEHRLTVRFASVMVVLTGIVLAAIRYLPHG